MSSPPKPSRALLDFDGAKVVEKLYTVKTAILYSGIQRLH